MLSVYLGVCDEDGMLSFPSESEDEGSVETTSRDWGGLALRLPGAMGAGAAADLGEDFRSFLVLGLRGPLVPAVCLVWGTTGAVSLSTLKPPLGSSTTGGFSDFFGCFLPTRLREFVPLSHCAGDFWRPRPPSAPFCGARRSLLGGGNAESFEPPPWLPWPRPELLSRPSFLYLGGVLLLSWVFLIQFSSCHLLEPWGWRGENKNKQLSGWKHLLRKSGWQFVVSLHRVRPAVGVRWLHCPMCCFHSHCRSPSCSLSRCGCSSRPSIAQLLHCYCCLKDKRGKRCYCAFILKGMRLLSH